MTHSPYKEIGTPSLKAVGEKSFSLFFLKENKNHTTSVALAKEKSLISLWPGTLEFSVIFVEASINGLQSSATSSKLES